MSVLQFDEASHTYLIDGVRVPSVTQVLKPLYDFSRVDPIMLQAKAALGTAVHLACELLDNDDLDEESEDGRAALAPLAGYLAGYKKFKAECNPVVIFNERQLHHPVHRYAGTIDRRYSLRGDLWDIDLKSTVSMSPVVGLQTAAYTEMFKANAIGGDTRARRGALQLFPDGKYKLWEFKDPADFSVFLSLLTVQRYKERHSL
jgi:hypothetical protein